MGHGGIAGDRALCWLYVMCPYAKAKGVYLLHPYGHIQELLSHTNAGFLGKAGKRVARAAALLPQLAGCAHQGLRRLRGAGLWQDAFHLLTKRRGARSIPATAAHPFPYSTTTL